MGILGLVLVGLGSVIVFHPNTASDSMAAYVMFLAGLAILAVRQFGDRRS